MLRLESKCSQMLKKLRGTIDTTETEFLSNWLASKKSNSKLYFKWPVFSFIFASFFVDSVRVLFFPNID